MKNAKLITKTGTANFSCFQDILGLSSSVFYHSRFTLHASQRRPLCLVPSVLYLTSYVTCPRAAGVRPTSHGGVL
jgi:hypothetical protein